MDRVNRSREENRLTQPVQTHRIFGNSSVLTEGWYPVCPSRRLRRGRCESFLISRQRIVCYRGEDGRVRALDAFCPHMGADLGHGTVVGDEIRCAFHHWQFNETGRLTGIPYRDECPRASGLNAYPVEEKYGFVWVYAAPQAPYPVPQPPGLEGMELQSFYVGTTVLHAHHHVMMANGIDLQHFSTVHDLDVRFRHTVQERSPLSLDWEVRGELGDHGRWARFLRSWIGPELAYTARFAGGSVAAITYGPGLRLRGTGPRLPTLHILWGCVPIESGVSRVHVFLVGRRRATGLGRLAHSALLGMTYLLLASLKRDDARAFPNVRFGLWTPTPEDASVSRLVRWIETLPISLWSGGVPNSHADTLSDFGRVVSSLPA